MTIFSKKVNNKNQGNVNHCPGALIKDMKKEII